MISQRNVGKSLSIIMKVVLKVVWTISIQKLGNTVGERLANMNTKTVRV
jgi:hypothetical protein